MTTGTRGIFVMNFDIEGLGWVQVKVATVHFHRGLVYRVETLARDAKVLAKTSRTLTRCVEDSDRQPGIQYSHTDDLCQVCLRLLSPPVPKRGPRYRFTRKQASGTPRSVPTCPCPVVRRVHPMHTCNVTLSEVEHTVPELSHAHTSRPCPCTEMDTLQQTDQREIW